MASAATQRAKCTIHVSSLPAETTKDLLLAAFIPFGEIVDFQIPVNEEGAPPLFLFPPEYSLMLDNSIRGFAYIEFEDPEDAQEAIFNMNDAELYNRVIKVEMAKPHRGLAGLDSTLPGILLHACVLMSSMATRRMD
jgi:RNA recognition motif-containing protein